MGKVGGEEEKRRGRCKSANSRLSSSTSRGRQRSLIYTCACTCSVYDDVIGATAEF